MPSHTPRKRAAAARKASGKARGSRGAKPKQVVSRGGTKGTAPKRVKRGSGHRR